MRRGRNAVPFFTVVVCAGVILALIGFRDAFIVNWGIRMYRLIGGILGAACVAGGGTAVFGMIKRAGTERRARLAEAERVKMIEAEGRAPADLSVKGKLNNLKLRNLLERQVSMEWIEASGAGSECITQMRQMDEYQEKLHALLADNDAEILSDSEDVLDSAEQYMCRNVRKVLNYMSVADSRSGDDVEMILAMTRKCSAQNAEQLKRVQEFVYAVTEYLNHQGENDTDVEMLEIYKKTILNSIGEEAK